MMLTETPDRKTCPFARGFMSFWHKILGLLTTSSLYLILSFSIFFHDVFVPDAQSTSIETLL